MIKKHVAYLGWIVLLLALSACFGGPADPGVPTPTTGASAPRSSAEPLDGSPSDEIGDDSGDDFTLPSLSSEPVKLTLSVISSTRFLELAKQKFEALHPLVSIEIKEYIAAPAPVVRGGKSSLYIGDPDPKDLEKFSASLNTELMSGKASDIIVTNKHFPFRKYADKRLLADLNPYMANDSSFKREDYYANVLSAMTTGSKLYALPASLSLNMMVGNGILLDGSSFDDSEWTWSDFQAVASAFGKTGLPKAHALSGTDEEALLRLMVNSSFASLVDYDDAAFDEQALQRMLLQVRSLTESGLVTEQPPSGGNELFRIMNPVGFKDLVLLGQMMFDGNGALYNLPSDNKIRGISFTSDLLLSVNEKSPHKREAWEFIKFVLSEEMQLSADLSGFPLNARAAELLRDNLQEIGPDMFGSMSLKLDGASAPFVPAKPSQADIERAGSIMASVAFWAETDPRIAAIIGQEARHFFAGRKSAEETVRAVGGKVRTLLRE